MIDLVSIIVPVYNVEKYLNRCVDSLVRQTYRQLEIILVDDGSWDDSGNLCDEWKKKDDRIKVIHKKNGGLASARNAGLEYAQGEFICFVDSDDWVDVQYVQKQYEALVKNQVDVVVCSHSIEFVNDCISKPIVFLQEEIFDKNQMARGIYLLEETDVFNTVWNKMYSRNSIENLLFELNSEPGEDLLFNVECFIRINRMMVLPDVLYFYMRQDEMTLTSKYKQGLYELSQKFNCIQRKLYEFYDMVDTQYFSTYKKAYIYRVFTCIPNMYRKNSNMTVQQRRAIFEKMKMDIELATYLKEEMIDDIHIKYMKKMLNAKSASGLDRTYKTLFFIRNRLEFIYKLIRKIIRKGVVK